MYWQSLRTFDVLSELGLDSEIPFQTLSQPDHGSHLITWNQHMLTEQLKSELQHFQKMHLLLPRQISYTPQSQKKVRLDNSIGGVESQITVSHLVLMNSIFD